MLVAEKKKPASKSPDWEFKASPNNKVTPTADKQTNQLIDVFLKGVDKGKQNAIKELKQKFLQEYNSNIKKAQALGESFFNLINDDYKLNCSVVYLMADGMNDFKLLFLVEPEDYLSKKFTKIYSEAISEKKKLNKDKFHISIMFVPEVETLDKKKIMSDGYTYYYNGQGKK